MHPVMRSVRTELWRRSYPTVIGALLSVFQMFLTLVIVGCEIGGDFVHFPRMNVFIGYATFPNFMCAWISLASASCCRTRCCGIATLVFQCLAIPASWCVIGFDAYFLNNPTLCFFSTNCDSYKYYYGSYYDYDGNSTTYRDNDLRNTDSLYAIKVPLIKGQLAAGVLMFAVCLAFIIMFAVTSCRVRRSPEFQSHTSGADAYRPGPSIVICPPQTPAYPPPSNIQMKEIHTHPIIQPNVLSCPNCGSSFQIADERF